MLDFTLKMLHGISLLQLLGASVILTCLYTAYTIFYNLFLHPLRTHPGPKAFAATAVPFHRILYGGSPARKLLDIHKQYGPVVRVTPNQVSYVGPQAHHDIFAHHQNQADFPKDLLAQPPPTNGVPGMIVANRENHARQRKVFSHAFSDVGLKAQEPKLRELIGLLVRRLRHRCLDGPQDMVKWYTWAAFDIMGDLAFGESFGCIDREEAHPWVQQIPAAIRSVRFVHFAMSYNLFSLLKLITPGKIVEERRKMMVFGQRQVDKRIDFGSERGDFWDKVIVKAGEVNGLTREEMHTNANTIMTAGSETTATLLSGVTYLLLKHPHIMRKLVEEIRTAFKSDKEVNLNSVKDLTYMLAVLNEGLRIYPPVPLNFDRLAPKGGAMVVGRFVPEGTSVMVPQFAMHRMESNFYDPENFHPERFLPESHPDYDSKFANDDRTALQPFVQGPRNCIGENLACAEMRMVLATVLWNFDFELDKSTEDAGDWLYQENYRLWIKTPLWVNLKPREVSEKS